MAGWGAGGGARRAIVFRHAEHLTLGWAGGARPAGPATGARGEPRTGTAAGVPREDAREGDGDGAWAAAPAAGPAQLGHRQEPPG